MEILDDEITLQANSIPLSNSMLQNNPYKLQNQNSQAQTSSPSTTSQNYKDDDDIGMAIGAALILRRFRRFDRMGRWGHHHTGPIWLMRKVLKR